MNKKKVTLLSILILAVLAALFFLTGCAPAASTVDTTATQASPPIVAPVKETGVYNFGDVKTYTDGISISVSKPSEFTPGEFAIGPVAGQTSVIFTFVLTNNSDKIFEPSAYTSISSGGIEAEPIFDAGNPIGDIGNSPQTALLPGQTIQWVEGYSISNANNLTLQTSPASRYKNTIFAYIQ